MAVARWEEGGRAWAVKGASSAEGRGRLEREARLLRELGHPGLLEASELRVGDDGAELLTGWVAGGSLVEGRALTVEEVAGVVAAVATTLADLHQRGWVHGAVEPAHVLLHADGRPVLCGLGGAGRRGDPGPDGTQPLDPATDVGALGQLVTTMLARSEGGAATGRAALESLAAAASDPSPAARPSARALAAAVAHGVPGARLPTARVETPAAATIGPPAVVPSPLRGPEAAADALARLRAAAERRGRPTTERRWRPTATTLVGGGALFAGLLMLGLALRPPGARGTGTSSSVAPVTVVTTTSAQPTTTHVLCPGRPGRSSPEPEIQRADLDGDGCDEDIRVTDGVLAAGGRRWAVGRPGDRVLLGDWDCDGGATVALARPSTGEVFRFDGFASPGQELEAEMVGRLPAGTDLTVDTDDDECAAVVVTRPDGARRRLALHPAAQTESEP